MGARDLLAELAGAGFSVTADGDRLVIRPASKLTDDMRAALRATKPELLALLSGPSAEPGRWPDFLQVKFEARCERLRRWGWPDPDAITLAGRLTQRDAAGDDDRVSCADCRHAKIQRCRNHTSAGLTDGEIGRDWIETLQRCPGFAALAPI